MVHMFYHGLTIVTMFLVLFVVKNIKFRKDLHSINYVLPTN